jgi:hypothetical protein
MAVQSIDYMNARRDAKPVTGGKVYANTVNPVDERAALAGMSELDVIRAKLAATFAEQRMIVREFRNSLAAGLTADLEIPF